MKKFALLLLLLSISNTFAQTVSEDIIGKWQLQTVEIDGEKATAKKPLIPPMYSKYILKTINLKELLEIKTTRELGRFLTTKNLYISN